MKSGRKWIALVLGAALCLSLSTGCSSETKTEIDTGAEIEAETENDAGTETVIPEETTPAVSGGTVRIITRPVTEQYFLGEMMGVLIEEYTDMDVEITRDDEYNYSDMHTALMDGEYDLYPEYTITAWNTVYQGGDIPDDDERMLRELKEYYDALGLAWSDPFGSHRNGILLVQREVADRYGLETYSDLAAVAGELTLYASVIFYDEGRAYNYDALCETYNMEFEYAVYYASLFERFEQGEADVLKAYSTDPELAVTSGKVLEDDLHFFKNNYSGAVIRKDLLEAHPELEGALNKMSGILTDDEMAQLNYEQEYNGKDAHELAVEFLTQKGLLNAG
ncbi:MAG: glycine betaine ABC transporter substrate-binding protein [Oscillospiraceae bacterium]